MNKKTMMILIPLFLTLFLASGIQAANAVVHYTLIVTNSNSEMGSISPKIGIYSVANGTYLTFTAYPNEGYGFAGWIRETPGVQPVFTTENPMTIHPEFPAGVELRLNVTAVWGPENITLTIPTVDNGYTDYDGVTPLPLMSEVTITATPSTGYIISAWIVNDVPRPAWPHVTTNQTNLRLSRNTVVIPVFASTTAPSFIPPLLLAFVTPAMIIGGIGGSFWTVGRRLGGHEVAGFLIGGSMGLVLTTQVGLVPAWLTIIAFIIGGVGFYFWFKGGE